MTADIDKVEVKEDQPQPLSRKLKILTTIVIFYGNITYGCSMNSYGPSLNDFKKKYDVSTSTISVMFTIQIACYMVGALSCTVLYNFINRQFAVFLIFVGMSTTMFVNPYLPNLETYYVLGGFIGFCMGCYDAAQIVWIMEMWQKECVPFVQAQHFCYAVGAVLSPVLMSPFLSDDTDEDEDDTVTTTTTTASDTKKESNLTVPYTIMGAICAVTAIGHLLLFIFMRYRPPPPEVSAKEAEEENSNNNDKAVALANDTYESPSTGGNSGNFVVNWVKSQWPGWHVARLVILSGLFLGADQGMEMCTMQLFPTFGQNSDVKLSDSASADTLTGYNIAFMVGRGVGIPLVLLNVPSVVIVYVDAFIVLVGNIILVIWAINSKAMIWTAGILYGIGYASLQPAFCSYMERYLEFTNTIGAMMVVCGSFAGSMYPLIVGSSIDHYPRVMAFPIFFSLAVIFVTLTTSLFITRKMKQRGE